jgi:hypothetical protein
MAGCDRRAAAGSTVLEHHDAIDRQARRRFLMARSARTSRQRGELRRHVRTAPRSRAWPEVAETLEFGLVGALVHASCGADTFRQTAEGLVGMVAIVLPDR